MLRRMAAEIGFQRLPDWRSDRINSLGRPPIHGDSKTPWHPASDCDRPPAGPPHSRSRVGVLHQWRRHRYDDKSASRNRAAWLWVPQAALASSSRLTSRSDPDGAVGVDLYARTQNHGAALFPDSTARGCAYPPTTPTTLESVPRHYRPLARQRSPLLAQASAPFVGL